ncbi:MAG: tRNA (guanosine(37)-N1)-methyltransferase TrmD [Alphaproteobacteria bacterium]|nr:tRNA (guanosine(37)-N1)-methyltransferase TrmD [Alphaproteobacteria bacterium]
MTQTCFNAYVLTLFPEMFPTLLGQALAGKALDNGVWKLHVSNIRDFAEDIHKSVDDMPYGGGAGMVMRPDVLGRAIESLPKDVPIYYLSPRGQPLQQSQVKSFAKQNSIGLICGRYEGIDERVLDYYGIKELSIGDYVLSGGEVGAHVVLDAIIRLREGFMGQPESLSEESFENNLLEYPHYTRPAVWKEQEVPEVLLSGHHEKIKQWRHQKSQEITAERRPDLLQVATLKKKDLKFRKKDAKMRAK